jgi:hypothetical protein
MATSTGNFPSDDSTLANFQAWTGAIYNAFIAFGCSLNASQRNPNGAILAWWCRA